jgi:DNA transformation protein
MKALKGTRLFVNLSATQVRRRLKGHGFGVRKVASDGRNRAVIIHTATGEHCRDLEALFQDALDPATEQPVEQQEDPT